MRVSLLALLCLLLAAPPCAAEAPSRQALAAAIQHKDAARVKALLANGAPADDEDGAPLRLAVEVKRADIAGLLLQAGARVNGADGQGRTALFEAAGQGDRGCAMAELLLAHGAAVNAPNHNPGPDTKGEYGFTPLHLAAGGGAVRMAALLLAHHADLEAQSENGKTPLTMAIRDGGVRMMDFLLQHGAKLRDPNAALHDAARTNNVATGTWLLRHGADPSTAIGDAAECGWMEMTRLLLRHGARTSATDAEDRTPLLRATTRDTGLPVVRLLLTHGAKLGATDRNGDTALILALSYGNLQTAEYLLQRGIRVNAANHEGETALHRAAAYNQEASVGLLLRYRADRRAKDRKGRTPLDIARAEGFGGVARLLEVRR